MTRRDLLACTILTVLVAAAVLAACRPWVYGLTEYKKTGPAMNAGIGLHVPGLPAHSIGLEVKGTPGFWACTDDC